MHAHSKTLLAQLGFSDKDKKNPLHDRACQYLADPATASSIGEHIIASDYRKQLEKTGENVFHSTKEVKQVVVAKPIQEHMLIKGSGQYKTTVGFIDVVLKFDVEFGYWGGGFKEAPLIWVSQWRKIYAVCEVKAGETAIGDIIRQMRIYKEFFNMHHHNDRPPIHNATNDFWIVATVYTMSQIDIQTLGQEGIHHIQLGDAFKAWTAKSNQMKPGDPGTIQSFVM